MAKAKMKLYVYTVDGRCYTFLDNNAKNMLEDIKECAMVDGVRTRAFDTNQGVEVAFILQNIVNTEAIYEV